MIMIMMMIFSDLSAAGRAQCAAGGAGVPGVARVGVAGALGEAGGVAEATGGHPRQVEDGGGRDHHQPRHPREVRPENIVDLCLKDFCLKEGRERDQSGV